MLKKFTLSTCILLLTLSLSCKENDDDEYIPIAIEANIDSVETLQDISVDISIFLNDVNIPLDASIELSTPNNGSVIFQASQTNFIESIITYTPESEFFGQDTFQYTVCENSNCATGTVNINVLPVTPVNFNLDAFPYDTLSEYNFFQGTLSNLNPVYGVLPYDLNSSLFTDYAKKKRFIWMPESIKATYQEDSDILDFDEGSVLIKNFYYDNVLPSGTTKIIETRLMIKKNNEWIFANYLWNDEQDEAFFTTSGSVLNLEWIDDDGTTKSVGYQVPPLSQCFTCHNEFGTPLPIGPKPQNLNKDYDYASGISNQLSKWIEMDYLADNLPNNIVSTVDWKNESFPLEDRVRSYLDINCAHCHSDERFCEYRPMRLAYKDSDERINMGVCVEPDTEIDPTLSLIITPGLPEKSVLYFRVNSLQAQYKMPLIGRNLKHTEGIQLIEDWILSLETNCQ